MSVENMEELKAKLLEFKAALPLDPNSLDTECVNHATLYDDIGTFVADLRQTARVAKNHLDFTFARLRKEIRENPAKFGVSKATGDAVDDAAKAHKDYADALQDYSDKLYLSDCGGVLKESAEHRKANLRDAVSLYVHNYYKAGPDAYAKSMMSEVEEEDLKKHRRKLRAAQRESEAKEEEHDEK
jgi:hypothetical protein